MMIEQIGKALFFMGFGVFILSYFLSSFTVAEESLQTAVGKEKVEEFGQLIESGQYNNTFQLSKMITEAVDQYNHHQISEWGISEEVVSSLTGEQGETFDLKKAQNSLRQLNNGEFKAQSLEEFGNWLDGRPYNDKASMQKDLLLVADNINKYSIISQRGFDRYQAKSLKYDLARASANGLLPEHKGLFLLLSYGLAIIGALMLFLQRIPNENSGIRNNGIFSSKLKARGWIGILTGAFLILFYVFLYFYPEHMINWIIMVDPISMALNGGIAGQFFLYGLLYTIAVLVMGVRMMIHYRHSRYQIFRTISVMFFQLAFAFLIPEILVRLNQPYFDFKNIWPLDYDFFFDTNLQTLISGGKLGIFMLGWGIALIVLGVPIFTYFYGKRWYCSWVCGCGGLAETLGDPFRQLSDKSLKAWRAERVIIHSVLVFAVVMTAAVLYTYFTGKSEVLGVSSYALRESYGAWIGAGFAGVIGTGFYPLMGNRVWCRFGCPLAAYLGLIQRFKSRFRITTNGGQCISCGNCSTYCEMGIDVRWYAQRGQNIVRSSCVGCGICSSVCPRGVLNLENGPEEGRFGTPTLTGSKIPFESHKS